jgi:hypothetical protein
MEESDVKEIVTPDAMLANPAPTAWPWDLIANWQEGWEERREMAVETCEGEGGEILGGRRRMRGWRGRWGRLGRRGWVIEREWRRGVNTR